MLWLLAALAALLVASMLALVWLALAGIVLLAWLTLAVCRALIVAVFGWRSSEPG